jgi:hypothetical protein
LDEVIGKKFEKNKIKEIVGQNIIVKEVIKKYVMITLNEDKKYAPFVYLAGEETFNSKVVLDNGAEVRFKAVIDRIDESSGTLRVIDYKTGSVEVPGKGVGVSDYFERNPQKQYKAFVQLYLYAMVLDSVADEKGNIVLKKGNKARISFSDDSSQLNLVVYPVTSLKKGSVVCQPIYRKDLDEYRAALKVCVEQIFNKDIPFAQAESGSKACSYCIFKQICGR